MQHHQQAAMAHASNPHVAVSAAMVAQQANMQAYHQALVQQQQQQSGRASQQHMMQQEQQKPTALNPDAVEFKPGSSVTSSPIPQPKQVLIQQMPQQQPQQPPDNKNVMVMPQPLAVIPNPQGVMSQYGGHHGPPLVALYPSTTLRGGYLAPTAMAQYSAAAMAQHNAMVNSNHEQQGNAGAGGGIMSPTSPTTQPQIIYHPQQQIMSHGQYIQQSQLHQMQSNAHMLQLQPGQMPTQGQSGGPYANPLQPHHPAVFPYPPNVG